MAAYSANITIDKGTNYESEFTLFNTDGSLVDLTGYSISAKIKKNSTASTFVGFYATSITPTTGKVILSMGSTITSQLKSGRNQFDVIITSPSGSVTKVIEGMVFVRDTISV